MWKSTLYIACFALVVQANEVHGQIPCAVDSCERVDLVLALTASYRHLGIEDDLRGTTTHRIFGAWQPPSVAWLVLDSLAYPLAWDERQRCLWTTEPHFRNGTGHMDWGAYSLACPQPDQGVLWVHEDMCNWMPLKGPRRSPAPIHP